ncbi:MAG TPA: DUF58 domain-containing protein [Tepidisphaeraceae bacterium]|nr:DUF58 domain-containing protein [Tepidisphaeraceae bacterium]
MRRKPTIDFSITGLIYCSMMMFMGLAAINSQANLLFGVFGLMIGVLLVSGSVSKLVLRGLKIARTLPETASVGQPTTIVYRFTNAKKVWPSLSVSLGELDGTEAFTAQPYCYMLHAAPGMTATVPIEMLPKRRGLHVLDRYQISTSFPFGFIKRADLGHEKDTLLVFPAIAEVEPKLLSMLRSGDKSGAMIRPRQGGQDEFFGVKEFRRGENPRRIYWKRSARTGVLVAKEMTQVAPPRLMLLVDTYIQERSEHAHADVERAIAMAASLSSHALEQGLLVGVCAWTGEWVTVAPGRGKRQRRDLLALLARLPLNVQHNTLELLAAAHESSDENATPVLLSPRELSVGLGEQVRTGMIALCSASKTGQQWFRFRPQTDFVHCMPADQEMMRSFKL